MKIWFLTYLEKRSQLVVSDLEWQVCNVQASRSINHGLLLLHVACPSPSIGDVGDHISTITRRDYLAIVALRLFNLFLLHCLMYGGDWIDQY